LGVGDYEYVLNTSKLLIDCKTPIVSTCCCKFTPVLSFQMAAFAWLPNRTNDLFSPDAETGLLADRDE
jgi:hypothetical protein